MPGIQCGDCRAKIGIDGKTYVYLNIPKNASSFIKAAWDPSESRNILKDQFPEDTEYVISIRDPFERWISGFAQDQIGNTDEHKVKQWEDVIENIDRDHNEHLRPQVSFFQDLELKHITYFLVNDNLEQNIKHWAKGRVDIDEQKLYNGFNLNQYNQSVNDPEKMKVINWLRLEISLDPSRKQTIQEFYQDDYKFIQNTNFYKI